jgi:uncharacterized protein (TIGR00369 family)
VDEIADRFMATAIFRTLKAEIIEHGGGRAVIRYPVQPEFFNGVSQLQGGMYGAMMDCAMAVAANGIATAQLQYSILQPVTEGHLIVTGEVVKAGRTVLYCEAEVRDDQGRLIAKGSQNGLVRRRRAPGDGDPA